MTANPEPVVAGDLLDYNIGVGNFGPDTATNVTLTDMLPQRITFISTTPPCGFEAPNVVICNLGNLVVNDSSSVVIHVRTDPNTAGSFTNQAQVNSGTIDPDPSNNTASATTTLTSNPNSDGDGIPDSSDNCPNIANPIKPMRIMTG